MKMNTSPNTNTNRSASQGDKEEQDEDETITSSTTKSDKDMVMHDYESGSDWLAVPFGDRSTILKLSEKFIPAEGPPQIVMIDADSGMILNRGALSQMLASPNRFPWKADIPLDILLGRRGGDETSSKGGEGGGGGDGDKCEVIYPHSDRICEAKEAVVDSKYIGLYFSADWCTPCKVFITFSSFTLFFQTHTHIYNGTIRLFSHFFSDFLTIAIE
jgi:hypothetical protein